MTSARSIVVVPARGGSKGIPRKNLELIGGEPLIGRAIRAALSATSADRVVVTTDDHEIGEVAASRGAEVVHRPPDLATDVASSESAVLHAIEVVERAGPVPEILVMVQCTSPFVEGDDLDGVVSLVEPGGADCAFTATESHAFLWTEAEGSLAGLNHDPRVRLMRQQRPRELLETGAAYAWRTARFRAERHRFYGRIAAHEVPRLRSMEIDAPEDLDLARAIDPIVRRDSLPRRVDAVAFDFDGVFTDNTVTVSADGDESVRCSRSDGQAISMIRARGVPAIVLSTEKHAVVSTRCNKLGVPVIQGLEDKREALLDWAHTINVPIERVAFLGNDINDLPALVEAGTAIVVSDASPEARSVADVVLRRAGGAGAVRELCDLVMWQHDGWSGDDEDS